MAGLHPRIKPLSDIIITAARLFNTDVLDAGIELDRKLRELNIPKLAAVLYVNWADYNVLTYNELADELDIDVCIVQSHLNKLRRRFPCLFIRPTVSA